MIENDNSNMYINNPEILTKHSLLINIHKKEVRGKTILELSSQLLDRNLWEMH